MAEHGGTVRGIETAAERPASSHPFPELPRRNFPGFSKRTYARRGETRLASPVRAVDTITAVRDILRDQAWEVSANRKVLVENPGPRSIFRNIPGRRYNIIGVELLTLASGK